MYQQIKHFSQLQISQKDGISTFSSAVTWDVQAKTDKDKK